MPIEKMQDHAIELKEGFVLQEERIYSLSKKERNSKLEFSLVGDFLAKLKKEFGKKNNKLAKVVKLKRVE